MDSIEHDVWKTLNIQLEIDNSTCNWPDNIEHSETSFKFLFFSFPLMQTIQNVHQQLVICTKIKIGKHVKLHN